VKLRCSNGPQKWRPRRAREPRAERAQHVVARAHEQRCALDAEAAVLALLRAPAPGGALYAQDLCTGRQQLVHGGDPRHAGADDCDAGGRHGRPFARRLLGAVFLADPRTRRARLA
jgi:hypothetical protein